MSRCVLSFLILADCLRAAEPAHETFPPPKTVSIPTYTPPDHVVRPMPIAERISRHAVPERGICSTIPATREPDGLFSGNGTMSISVFGDLFEEQVYFRDEKILQPWKTGQQPAAPVIAPVLDQVRALMLQGEYRKGLELAMDAAAKAGVPQGTGNQEEHPAFDMRINATGVRHPVSEYLRSLDFETGEARVTWKDGAGVWVSRSFVSRPDGVVAQSLTAPENGELNLDIRLDTAMILRRRPATTEHATPVVGGPYRQHAVGSEPGASEIHFKRNLTDSYLSLEGRYLVDQGHPGYASVTRVAAQGGKLSGAGEVLQVRRAHSLLLLTRIGVYEENMPTSASESLRRELEGVSTDYDALLARHRGHQAEVIDRVKLDFGGAQDHYMSGEEMLIDQRTREGFNPALLEDLYDMGRYWLLARTDEYTPIWGHVNINVNLQVSSAPTSQMPEVMDAFVRWVESLIPDSRANARNIFGARGVLFATHPTQYSGKLTHFEFTWPHQYWISAGGWLYSPVWDYYLVTGNPQFLREHVLPGLKELALFYEDYLKETDATGHYIFVPSYSPENWPSNSQGSPAVINADMDIAVCREVFRHLITAAQTLGTDQQSIPKWQAILAKLPPYLLDADGALKEWAWPMLEERLDHRHVSHLYGAWPGDEITPDRTPQLARGAWLAARKRAQGNASAHGVLHRSLAAARLKDPWLVTFDMKQLLEQGYVNPSLTTNHNPYAFAAPDPQGALPTLMMESLLYSRPGLVELLPAIPSSLRKGSAMGLMCRTQAKADRLSWDLDGKKIEVTLSSPIDQTISLVEGRGIESAQGSEDGALGSFSPGAESVSLNLRAGHSVTVRLQVGHREPYDWIASVPAPAPEP